MNVKGGEKNNRVYLCLNIITFLAVGCVTVFYSKMAFNETGTGVYYRKLESGKGKSIDECINEIKKEREKSKSNKPNTNEDSKDVRYILKVERCVTYKGDVIEYPNQCSRNMYIYDYINVKNNNYLGDYYECLNMLNNVGDRYLFKIKLKDAYINTVKNIQDDQYICLEIKLVDVFDSYNLYNKQIEHFQNMFKHYQESKELDKEIIMMYLENIRREYSNVGDYFVILDDPGRGERIKNGDKVKYNYYIKTHGGKIINTNIKKIAEENGIYNDKYQYKPNEIVINESDYSPLSSFIFFKRGSIGKIFYPLKDPLYIAGHKFIEVYIEIIDVKHEEKKKDDATNKQINEIGENKGGNNEIKGPDNKIKKKPTDVTANKTDIDGKNKISQDKVKDSKKKNVKKNITNKKNIRENKEKNLKKKKQKNSKIKAKTNTNTKPDKVQKNSKNVTRGKGTSKKKSNQIEKTSKKTKKSERNIKQK